MADGLRFPQQGAGNFFYPHTQHQSRHLNRNSTPPNTIRAAFNNHNGVDTPSPSRSPASNSPAQNLPYGMYGQGHNQGQHGRVNGPNGRGMPMHGTYQFPHQNSYQGQQQQQQQQQQNQQNQHANTQPVLQHLVSGTDGSIIGHQNSYHHGGMLSTSAVVFPNVTANTLPNGHSTTTRGGQAQQITEHWAEQLKLHKETEQAHTEMVVEGHPQYYARKYSAQNTPGKIVSNALEKLAKPPVEEKQEDRGRPVVMDEVKRQDWNDLDLSGQGLRVLSSPVFRYSFLQQLYLSSNQLTRIPPEIGKLRRLRHLNASHNNITELPAEIGMCVYLQELLVFNNKLETLPHEMGSLFQLKILGIEGNPSFDATMKSEIMERGTESLITMLREQAEIPDPPRARQILDLQDGAPVVQDQERFKVFSFNILCDRACTNQLYGHSPARSLTWDYRKEQILAEIRSQDAEIVCLQEVDQDSFKEFFCPKLAYDHYRGVFWPKSRAKTMSEKDAKMVDGCATFFKISKYLLLDKQLIDFASIAINRPDMKNQHDIFNRVMPKDQHAVVCFFENKLTGSRFIVANAHLHWDPKFADVKVIQTAILMDYVSKLAEKYVSWPPTKDKDKKNYSFSGDTAVGDEAPVDPPPPVQESVPSMTYTSSTQIPLIIAGDFNSLSDSGVYALLSSGSLDPDHPDLGDFQYGNFTRDGIQHPFSLRSAYATLNGGPDQLPFTNYTPGFVGVVDYIWFSTNTLELTTLLGPVDSDYMTRVPGFPNYHFPSDHLSLLAEFTVKGRKEKKAIVEPDFGSSSTSRRH